ncbi:type IV secretion system protein VirB10 [Rhizobium rhizogenes]|uniref:type IV secretion system protein VirB10 n=1 Tax=Rhizobium rhizogenes TaxID=359 RepID=UPI001571CDCC|nr:type IV secretion system protein VirB10 [Rhizobium rhizogenes]NTG64800.1 TrbI/VirB10 family protein [Rhizobium rhizogenes]NTH68507.1 TrbI/VirB10 family protein [Rhizobium rhizogenes]NTI00003.1 TrbI/VirB10 family protein [Rhizobium rhizogenes]NTI39135.1 TrbI/VirB10 family protein [Rhizobium rhizogenes]NTJ18294.1 TrbI/VirB10 family protein [Rhizobium rhizogenes]
MAIDFEEEARIVETVAKPADSRRGRLAPVLLASVALVVLAYAGYVSFIKPQAARKTDANEEFKTASHAAHLNFDPENPSPPPSDNKLVLVPPTPTPTVVPPPQITAPVVMPPVIDEEAARRAAEEAERARKEEELRQARLRSNMLVVDQSVRGENAASVVGAASQQNAGSGGSASASADDDPNRRFVQSVGSQDVETVTASRNDRIDALIPQGALIRGVLETAIQSDLPGMVRAVISTDVYSFDGRRILLPKGTMLTGEYKSGMARGQTRILIVWTRALRSDGTSVALGSYGTDDLGRSGLSGFVDKHYLERFGAAAVLSMVGGISSFVAGLNNDGSSSSGSTSSSSSDAQTQAQQALSQTMAEMANIALKDSINIPPTIYVDQGTQIMVFVRKDLDFSSLYPDPVKEAVNELRRARIRNAPSTSGQ